MPPAHEFKWDTTATESPPGIGTEVSGDLTFTVVNANMLGDYQCFAVNTLGPGPVATITLAEGGK